MKIREKICLWLFTVTDKPYAKYFKKKRKPWSLGIKELMALPKGTWGNELSKFLNNNGFEILPKLERHDAYHVFLKIGIEVKDEIGMQYLLFGNGKRTPYLFSTMIVGTVLVPDYFKYYKSLYKRGKELPKLYDLKVENMLHLLLEEIQKNYKIIPPLEGEKSCRRKGSE
ncbi:MAG: hypothetical protein MK078_01930 [Crocinitomicaceae bacterium]|nr:hypothetical protein [Crocinitomicaceae bacterium]